MLHLVDKPVGDPHQHHRHRQPEIPSLGRRAERNTNTFGGARWRPTDEPHFIDVGEHRGKSRHLRRAIDGAGASEPLFALLVVARECRAEAFENADANHCSEYQRSHRCDTDPTGCGDCGDGYEAVHVVGDSLQPVRLTGMLTMHRDELAAIR